LARNSGQIIHVNCELDEEYNSNGDIDEGVTKCENQSGGNGVKAKPIGGEEEEEEAIYEKSGLLHQPWQLPMDDYNNTPHLSHGLGGNTGGSGSFAAGGFQGGFTNGQNCSNKIQHDYTQLGSTFENINYNHNFGTFSNANFSHNQSTSPMPPSHPSLRSETIFTGSNHHNNSETASFHEQCGDLTGMKMHQYNPNCQNVINPQHARNPNLSPTNFPQTSSSHFGLSGTPEIRPNDQTHSKNIRNNNYNSSKSAYDRLSTKSIEPKPQFGVRTPNLGINFTSPTSSSSSSSFPGDSTPMCVQNDQFDPNNIHHRQLQQLQQLQQAQTLNQPFNQNYLTNLELRRNFKPLEEKNGQDNHEENGIKNVNDENNPFCGTTAPHSFGVPFQANFQSPAKFNPNTPQPQAGSHMVASSSSIHFTGTESPNDPQRSQFEAHFGQIYSQRFKRRQ
jgi:hypothetical protein